MKKLGFDILAPWLFPILQMEKLRFSEVKPPA